MNTDKSAETKNAGGRGKPVGGLTGAAIGFILIAIGIMVSLTGVGLVIGIPLILAGVAYPLIARSLIRVNVLIAAGMYQPSIQNPG